MSEYHHENEKKLEIGLPYLLKHNREHEKDIQKWFQRAREAQLDAVADDLQKVLELSQQILVMTSQLVDIAEQIGQPDYDYIKRGIDMNLRICKEGHLLHAVGYYISELVVKKQREGSIFSSCEVMTRC